jgi:hypothetical protein
MATIADMRAGVSIGDAARSGGNYQNAIIHYKAAGQMGADTVGPAIDVRTSGATAGLTQRAWDMNGLLAGLNDSDSATSDDADQAKKFIDQIMAWYTAANAYSVAPAAHADVKLPALVPTSSILPVYGAMPPIGQALPKPVAAPPPVAAPKPIAAPAAVKTYAPPPVKLAPAVKKSPISLKNVLAGVVTGVAGCAVFGLPGIVLGALGGGLGSKYLLKW